MSNDLRRAILNELDALYPATPGDTIAAARIAAAIERAGWRRVTWRTVRDAMNRVPNLGVEAYEPTVSEFTAALRADDE